MLTVEYTFHVQMGNKGAFIRFESPGLEPKIVTFAAVVSIFYLLQSIVYFSVFHLLLNNINIKSIITFIFIINWILGVKERGWG